jgi:DNA-binding SARP family transcriptional activator
LGAGPSKVIEFRVLGSLEVVDQDSPLTLGPPQQRALLAVLVLHRGEAVSSDRLIDEIWGERPPVSANKLVQGYVSSLRKVLGDGLLVTRGHAYLLQAEPGQVDINRFQSLLAEGRAALGDDDPQRAAERLREALGLWRGPPLADFAYQPFAQSEIARLEELRLVALEERIDAQLALGEHVRLVSELEALVREHPVREHLRGQLMIALYRAGRQADALEAYRNARRELLDERGLEPGRRLQELERAILAHDPGLEPPARRTARPPPAIARKGLRRPALIAAGGAVLLAVIAVVALKLAGSGASTVRVAPNSVAAIDVRSGRVVSAVPVGDRPGPITFGSGSLWVANLDDQTISRIDPGTPRTVGLVRVPGPPTGIAAGPRGLWVVETPGTSSVLVGRVDPVFNTFGAVTRVGNVVPGRAGGDRHARPLGVGRPIDGSADAPGWDDRHVRRAA